MSFISNVDQLSLGEGVYNNIQGNLNYNTVYNTFSCGRKRLQPDDRPDASGPATKRSRGGDALDRGLNVIPAEHLRLVLEIGSAPGYFVHAGEVAGRAVIVKVFNAGPTVREQLESTVALSQGLLHPNVLRLEGVSSPESLGHFLTYENAHWNSADGPMADALQCDLTRSIALGFKMVAGLSSGINYLSVQGISLGSLGMENFDIFLDVNDRFLISINPPIASNATRARPQNTTTTSWNILNSLCQKVLRSANRILHDENIERTPVAIAGPPRRLPFPSKSLLSELIEPSLSQRPKETNTTGIPPRREYVWRTVQRGQQSLPTIASRITRDLNRLSVNALTWSNERSAHRCAGYVREEITLATTTHDSAVVFHDAPSPMEVCPICHEVVGEHEVFRCICGDLNPGSRTTVKCQTCNSWSHIDCARKSNSSDFTCGICNPSSAREFLPDGRPFVDMTHIGLSLERSPNLPPSASQLYFKHWILMQQASGREKVNLVHAAKEAANEFTALSKKEKELYARLSQAAKDSPSVRLFGTNTR